MLKFLGIDLGTTYTQARLYEVSRWESKGTLTEMAFPGRETSRFPSAVYFPSPSAAPLAGEAAMENVRAHPNQVLLESKSRLAHPEDLEMRIRFQGGQLLTKMAWQVSSIVLSQAVKHMMNADGDPVDWSLIDGCTITYPASFPRVALGYTRKAATSVDLLKNLYDHEKLHFLPEPIAALLGAIHSDEREDLNPGELLLVVDVGAGTSDMTIVELFKTGDNGLAGKIVEVGEHILQAGNNYDEIVARNICQKLWPDPIDPKNFATIDEQEIDEMLEKFRTALILTARKIKETFVEDPEREWEIDIYEYGFLDEELRESMNNLFRLPLRTEIFLKSQELNQNILKELERPEGATLRSGLARLQERFRSKKGVDFNPTAILLAGGGARVYALSAFLKERYPEARIVKGQKPEALIAKGAAIYASLSEEERGAWTWPVNEDIYMLIKNPQGEKSWDLVWGRETPKGEYKYKIRNSGTDITIVLGNGFFDKDINIDRVHKRVRRIVRSQRMIEEGERIMINTWFDTTENRPYMDISLEENGRWFSLADSKIPLEFEEEN